MFEHNSLNKEEYRLDDSDNSFWPTESERESGRDTCLPAYLPLFVAVPIF